MNKELDDQLCTTYPKLYSERYKPVTETCMCWGFSCGNGWFNIINQLSSLIQGYLDWKNRKEEVVPQVIVNQVKEKFGTLRFYYTGGDDCIDGMVRMAESISAVTCENCGNPSKVKEVNNWLKCICDSCEQINRKKLIN